MTQSEYFIKRDLHLPKPKFVYGNRVFGYWNKIPFVGMVVREEEKIVLVHVDLPFKYEDIIQNILHIARKDVTLLVSYDVVDKPKRVSKTKELSK